MDLSGMTAALVPLVIIGCFCVGYVIKHIIPSATINKWIPLIVMVVGILLNIWVNKAVTPETVVWGAVSGLASTGLHQAITKAFNITDDSEE